MTAAMLPLTPLQAGMAFHDLSDGSGTYVQQLCWSLPPPVDLIAFRLAWEGLLSAHPALRVSVDTADRDGPVQRFHSTVAVPLSIEDWPDDYAGRLRVERQAGFDLTTPPLMRVLVLRDPAGGARVVWTYHHLILDGWSIALVLSELAARYRAVIERRRYDAPPAPSITEYLAWRSVRDRGAARDYWVGHLRPSEPPAALTFHTDTTARDFHVRTRRLDTHETDGLRAFCREGRVTLGTVLMAAWALVLREFTREPSVVLGLTKSGRPPELPGVERMVGLLINTVPVRIDLPPTATVADWLLDLQAEQVRSDEHSWSGLGEILQWCGRPWDASAVHSLFVFENYPTDVADTDDARFARFESSGTRTGHPLTLVVTPTRGELAIELTFDTTRLGDATADRLLGQFLWVLCRLPNASATPLGRVSTFPPDEWAGLLRDATGPVCQYPGRPDLHSAIERTARTYPDRVAVVFDGESQTYGELSRRARKLAGHLIACGVREGGVVAVVAERSADLMSGLIGVLYAGAAYLPLDPTTPVARRRQLLRDAGAVAVVADAAVADEWAVSGLPLTHLDRPETWTGTPLARQVVPHPDHLAYVIFTSGSTGTPKGVGVSHRAIANRLDWMQQRYNLTASDSVLQKTPLTFDVSVWELFWPLREGATLVVARPGEHRDADRLTDLIRGTAVTVCHFVPTMARAFLASQSAPLCHSLRLVVCSGEALAPDLADQFRRTLPAAVENLYGPTEAAVDVTAWSCPREPVPVVPIGHPIANISAFVLRSDLRPASRGAVGELFLAGVGLGRGYLSRPGLTAAAYLPNAVDSVSAPRMYRTGDLARVLEDGAIEYLGRGDHQVKLRGHRIELGAIEVALRQLPGVADAVVVLNGTSDRRRLVAYLATNGVALGGADRLRGALADRLAEHELPAVFVPLAELPRGTSGKVDRRSLPPPPDERPELDEAFVPPAAGAESQLARIWAEVLRIGRVGGRDNFFALGGDSILSLRVVALAREGGLAVTPRDLFEHPTVAGLARVVATRGATVVHEDTPPGPLDPYPIHHWFFRRQLPNPNWFNQAAVYQFGRAVDPDLVKLALAAVVRHHAALRLSASDGQDEWRLEIRPPDAASSFSFVECPDPTAVADELHRALDLSAGPLMAAAVGGGRLLLVIHHIAVDAVTWTVLTRDLRRAYADLEAGRLVTLPRSGTGLRGWGRCLQELARGDEAAGELAFWQEQVSGPTATLPLTGVGTAGEEVRAELVLTLEMTAALGQVADAERPGEFHAVLLGALAFAIGRWADLPEVCVDVESHGRDTRFDGIDLSATAGWFTAIYPLRLATGPTAAEAVARTRARHRRVARLGIGYGVMRYLEPGGDELASPAEVLFNYLGRWDAADEAGGWLRRVGGNTGRWVDPTSPRSHPLEVNAVVADGRLRIEFAAGSGGDRGQLNALVSEARAALAALTAGASADWLLPTDPALVRGLGFPDDAIEDVLPLLPLQEGILFHAVLAPGSGQYVEQTLWEVGPGFDAARFRAAWGRAVARHPALRAAFLWERVDPPRQVVVRGCAVPWAVVAAPADPQLRQSFMEKLLADDRSAGFDLRRPPLTRITLVTGPDGPTHVLWTHHHLVLDGWSVNVLLGEVADDLAGRTPPPAPPLRSLVRATGRGDLAAAERYWRTYLARVPVAKPMLVEGSFPHSGTGVIDGGLSREVSDRLAAFCRENTLTPNTVLLGVAGLLLARLCDEPEVTVGVTVSGREVDLPGVESRVGLLINTLPVRVRADDRPLIDRLHQLQLTLASVREHGGVPLTRIRGWAERGDALFRVLFVFENFPGAGGGGPLRITRSDGGHTGYPLSVVVMPGSVMRFRLKYDRSCLDETAVRFILDNYVRAVEQCMTDGGRGQAAVGPLVGPESRECGQAVVWPYATVPPCLTAVAQSTPDAIAFRDGNEHLTYRAFDRLANQLARVLRADGVSGEWFVVTLMPRGWRLALVQVATLKAGGVILPIDPDTPLHRLERFCAAIPGQCLLVRAASVTAPTGVPSVLWDDLFQRAATLAPTTLAGGPHPQQAAYALFTSGSTGEPKLVAVPHSALCDRVHNLQSLYALRPGDAVLHKSFSGFDVSIWEVLWPLAVGATVAVCPTGGEADPDALCLVIEQQGVTLVHFVPSLFRVLTPAHAARCRGLRTVLLGGEPLRPTDLSAFRDVPTVELHNQYGSTETCIDVAATQVRPDDPRCVGRPYHNSQLTLLGRGMEVVPTPTAGELFIGGASLARGYVNDPRRTAAAFVPDPWGEPGSRMFASGDLARFGLGGLVPLGRKDRQLKVRGQRIELGAVEVALAAHPHVGRVAVIDDRDPFGEVRVVAFVVPRGRFDVTAVQRHLRERLPVAALPGRYEVVDALPTTGSGKVAYSALRGRTTEAEVKPTTGGVHQEVLSGVWSRLLDRPAVGPEDDFFALGGHSLLALRLLSEVQDVLGVRLPLADVFAHPTLSAMARAVEQASRGEALAPVRVRAELGEWPASFTQRRLWFLDRFDPTAATYRMQYAWRLAGGVTPDQVESAVAHTAAAHLLLSARFEDREGQLVQVVPTDTARITLGPPAEGIALPELLASERAQPLDPLAGPPWRAKLWRGTGGDLVLVLTVHHIVFDEASADVFRRGVEAALGGQPVEAGSVQYRDFALWEAEQFTGLRAETLSSFWRNELQDVTPIGLPRAPGRGPEVGADLPWAAPPGVADGVARLARAEGCTTFIVLLAAFGVLLHRFTNAARFVVAGPVGQRTRSEFESVIGPFVNTVPFVIDVPPRASFRDHLRATRVRVLRAYEHADCPLDAIVSAAFPGRSGDGIMPLAFSLHRSTAGGSTGLLTRVPVGKVTPKFDLALILKETAGTLGGVWEYRANVYDPLLVERLAGGFTAVLEQLVHNPNTDLASFELLGGAERERLLALGRGPELNTPGSVPEVFERMADALPDAVAVAHAGGCWTYRELDRRANRLARWLKKQGVRSEEGVGVTACRGADMVACFLGILKAGAAYVPLDPTYPAARLTAMTADAGVRLVLALDDSAFPHDLPARVVPPDEWGECREECPARLPPVPSGSLAYVMYTSGSTGRPKGVAIEHAGIVRLAHRPNYIACDPTDAVLQIAPATFDASTVEIWLPLLNGGRLVIAEHDQVELGRLAGLIRDEQVTVAHLTAGLFHQMVDAHLDEWAGLRTLLTGGDVLSPRHVVRAKRAYPDTRLVCCYGPTENTTFSSVFDVTDPAGLGHLLTVPLGMPVRDSQVYVLDDRDRLLPTGITGSLSVAGAGLARGYAWAARLTADAFRPDPFGRPGSRLYRTGDLVRLGPGDEVEFLGRADKQVKVRGYRIELAEVEAALLRHPELAECVADVVAHEGGHAQVVAYVVPRGVAPATADLLAFARRELPEHMVPARFVPLPAIPLTPHGKVDRTALAGLPVLATAAGPDHVPPRTDTERILAEVWAKVLRVSRVGTQDNFFELGGDSILSLQVVALARGRGVELTPRQMFDHQTIGELAAAAATAVRSTRPQPRHGPLAPSQATFLRTEDGDRNHWFQARALSAPAGVGADRLGDVLTRLALRHPALRLQFDPTDADAPQRIGPPKRVPVTTLDGTDPTAWVSRLRAGIDIRTGYVFAVGWVPGDEPVVVLLAHHLVVDTVSWGVLVSDVNRLFADGIPADEDAGTAYLEWSAALRREAVGGLFDNEIPYWKGVSAGAIGMPADMPDGENCWGDAERVACHLTAKESEGLFDELRRAFAARPEEALLAALAVALAGWTSNPTQVIECERHGRDTDWAAELDVTRTVGFFTAVFPLRLTGLDAADPADALLEVKDAYRAVPRAGVGYGALCELVGKLTPHVPEVGFNFLGRRGTDGDGTFRPRSIGPAPLNDPRRTRRHLIELEGYLTADGLRFTLTFSGARHRRETVATLAAGVLDALRRFASAAAGGRRLSAGDFPLVSLTRDAVLELSRLTFSVEDVLPLTPLQQGLVFQAGFDDERGLYVEQMSWDMRAGLTAEGFRSSWEAVLRRHPALRLAVLGVAGLESVALIAAGVALPFTTLDWSDVPADEVESRFTALMRDEQERPFDLARPPLMRVVWVTLPGGRTRVLWSVHHLLFDGWSLGVILGDLSKAGVELPPAPPYREYFRWLASPAARVDSGYWRHLSDAVVPTPLPVCERDPTREGYGKLIADLSAEQTAAVNAFCRRQRVTLSSLTQAAWAVLLARCSGSLDVVYGVTMSGRSAPVPGLHATVGLFINTLPARVRIDPAWTVAQLVAAVQERQVELGRYEHTPLTDVKRASGLTGSARLFESIFTFENYPPAAEEVGTEPLFRGHASTGTRTGYPVNWLIVPGGRHSVRLSYQRRELADGPAEALVRAYLTLLDAMARQPDGRVRDLPLLATGEQADRVTPRASPLPEDSVLDLFRQRVAEHPHRVAVTSANGCFTFAHLDRWSSAVAAGLAGVGVRAEDRVAVAVERGERAVVAILAAWKVGAAYVPLDPDYPAGRLMQVLDAANPSAVITTRQAGDQFAAVRTKVFVDDPPAVPIRHPHTPLHPDQIAYVLYTSGSTGVPKGVAGTHRGLLNRAHWMWREFPFAPDEVCSQRTPLGFVDSVWEVFGPLLAGVPSVVLSTEEVVEPERLVGALARGGVTRIVLVPTLLRAVLSSGLPLAELLPRLLHWTSSGEPLDREQAAEFHRQLPGRVLLNLYGSTEVAGDVTWHVVAAGETGPRVSIGVPLDNSAVYVTDDSGRLLPDGVPGHLLVAGFNLARGYLGDARQTADRFRPDPFARGRVYLTGDRAARTDSGSFDHRGRADQQVKLRGQRVELADVSANVCRFPGVAEAVAVVTQIGRTLQLVAHVCPRPPGGEPALRAFLLERLPPHMVPAYFVFHVTFPRLPNKKVDRTALVRHAPTVMPVGGGTATTPTQGVLVELWGELFPHAPVGVRDNFFDLGGDSIVCLQLVARARARGLSLRLRDVFEHQTIERIAEVLDVRS